MKPLALASAGLLLAALASAQAVPLPCSTLTSIGGCIECMGATKPQRCYLCSHKHLPVYDRGGIIKSCKAASFTCGTAGPRDPNCMRCDGASCLRCKPAYALNADGRCVTAPTYPATLTGPLCMTSSMNPSCAACNPDGTCKRCVASLRLVVPVNAIWLDAGYPETQCSTTAEIDAEAKAIINEAAWLPANCAEIDSDYQCNACKAGYGPVGGKKGITCAANTRGRTPGGCLASLPYMQYCKKCSTDGKKCLAGQCTGSRSMDAAGHCSLNCKGLWGIACLSCSEDACSKIDLAFANGRKL